MFEIYERADYKKIIAWVLQNWDKLNLPKTNQQTLKFNILPFRKAGLHSLLNFIVFSEEKPLIVLKMPRYKDGKLAFKAIEDEAKNLEFISAQGLLKENLPLIYKLVKIDNTPVIIMKAYEGKMLHQLLDQEESPAEIENLLKLGAAPLLSLNAPQEKTLATLKPSYITNQLKTVVQLYPDLLKKLETSLTDFFKERPLVELRYPQVFIHQEYNPWNLLCEQDNNLIILDWEDALRKSFPLLDMFNYFTVAFRILVVGETPSAKNRKPEQKQERGLQLINYYNQFQKEYCLKLNISQELVDFFFIVFCLNSTLFFIGDKRKEISYGRNWLLPLTNLAPKNCFESYLKQQLQSAGGQKG